MMALAYGMKPDTDCFAQYIGDDKQFQDMAAGTVARYIKDRASVKVSQVMLNVHLSRRRAMLVLSPLATVCVGPSGLPTWAMPVPCRRSMHRQKALTTPGAQFSLLQAYAVVVPLSCFVILFRSAHSCKRVCPVSELASVHREVTE